MSHPPVHPYAGAAVIGRPIHVNVRFDAPFESEPPEGEWTDE